MNNNKFSTLPFTMPPVKNEHLTLMFPLVSPLLCSFASLRDNISLLRAGLTPIRSQFFLGGVREMRADLYGIRTMLLVAERQIKFEIILEGRIKLVIPGKNDEMCGIATLSPLDMAAGKLLANSDRWTDEGFFNDEGVFNRDLIDLAMMRPSTNLLREAVAKAKQV